MEKKIRFLFYSLVHFVCSLKSRHFSPTSLIDKVSFDIWLGEERPLANDHLESGLMISRPVRAVDIKDFSS